MLRTVISGIVALFIAITFLSVVLLKIQEPVLWIVVGIGVAMMIWNLFDGVKAAKALKDVRDELPTGQQERQGVS